MASAPNLPGAQAGASVERGAGTNFQSLAINESKQRRFERKACSCGDLLYRITMADIFLQGGEPHYSRQDWQDTMHEYKNWAIITTNRTIPIIDLLPKDLQNRIKDIMGKPLTGKYALRVSWIISLSLKH